MTKQVFTANQVLTAAQMNSLQNNDFNWDTSTKTVSYVLLAADAGTRVIMNSASNTTITVNTGLFAAGDVLWIHNINTGTCTVTAGTATVNSAGSLALAQWEGGALYFTSASSAIFFRAGGIGYGVATGGSSASRTVGGINYTVLTFATDDNLVVSRAGLFDVLLVGGGGGGGGSQGLARAGGGGGAGALVGLASTTTVYLAAGTYAVDVGAGGAGSSGAQTVGLASYIGSVISACGGGGAGSFTDPYFSGRSGGSGGGASDSTPSSAGQSVDETFGNAGAIGGVGGNGGGGGGGYASAGGAGSGTTGGTGGNGIDVSSWGTSASTDNIAAGGAGGGATAGGTAGTGGVAGKTSGAGNNATTAGSGGGGTAGNTVAGGNGAAGKVWVRFRV